MTTLLRMNKVMFFTLEQVEGIKKRNSQLFAAYTNLLSESSPTCKRTSIINIIKTMKGRIGSAPLLYYF